MKFYIYYVYKIKYTLLILWSTRKVEHFQRLYPFPSLSDCFSNENFIDQQLQKNNVQSTRFLQMKKEKKERRKSQNGYVHTQFVAVHPSTPKME